MSGAERAVVATPAELLDRVGARLGASAWRVVDQAAIDAFAEVTGDRQWIHVDPELAASGPFGTTIAHGFLTLSLCAAFLDEALSVEDVGMQVNYGLDRVRFPAPAPAGSRMRGVVELVRAEAIASGVQAVLRVTVEIAGAEKPACVAELVVRFLDGTPIAQRTRRHSA